MLTGKTIIITGSSGFVGLHLVKKVKEEHGNAIELDVRTGTDITVWRQIEKIEKADVVVHLAGKSFVPESFQSPHEYLRTNINGTINMLELCRKFNARMIYTSSYVYGTPKYLPIDEEHPLSVSNPYALSKVVGEDLCRGYHQSFGVKVTIVRPFNIYGIGQNDNFLISSISHQASKGKVLLKDPSPRRDFIYIDDVIEAYLKLFEFDTPDFEIFNIGAGRSYSVQEIVNIVCEMLDENIKVEFTDEKRKNEIMETLADIAKAKRLLAWEPRVGIEEGIRRILYHVIGAEGRATFSEDGRNL